MRQIAITLPEPLPWQAQVTREAARFSVVAVGRRAGKTAHGIDRCADPQVLPYPVGWFSPTYKDMLEVWREVGERFGPITERTSVQDRRLEFITGGVLEFWSLENVQAGRGRKYRRVIIDEAAFVPTLLDSWNYAIRPTLADLRGDAWIYSTPKGRNGFWQMFQWGQDLGRPDWRSWQMPSSVNPFLPASELEEMRRNFPERVYQQEILAQFLEDAGGIFRRVLDAATATPLERGRGGAQYVYGIDWGRVNDFSVIVVLDVQTRSVVAMDRFTQIDYAVQMGRLDAMMQRFPPAVLVPEANSMGGPLIEQMQRRGWPVVPFTTTSVSKAMIIDGLALAFERGDIAILPDPVLIGELQAYEAERLPSGALRYSAPEGMHDDTVMALALAWFACSSQDTPTGRVVYDDALSISPY